PLISIRHSAYPAQTEEALHTISSRGISSDGQKIAFTRLGRIPAFAQNVCVQELSGEANSRLIVFNSDCPNAGVRDAILSGNGRYVAFFQGWCEGFLGSRIVRADIITGQRLLIAEFSSQPQDRLVSSAPSLSYDGNCIVY